MSTDVSTLELKTAVTADTLIEALRETGATVIWSGPESSASTRIELSVDIEADDAFDALPSRYFDDEDDWSEPAAADLKDFIGACVTGDRRLAATLLHRFGLSEGLEDYGQRMLLVAGGRA